MAVRRALPSPICAKNFESLGLRVSTHRPLPTVLGSAHYFTFEPSTFDGSALEKMADAFEAVIAGQTRMDAFSSLIGRADITWRRRRGAARCVPFPPLRLVSGCPRATSSECWQRSHSSYGRQSNFSPRVSTPPWRVCVRQLWLPQRQLFDESVDGADTLDEDRVLRGVRSFLQATLRTNWYLRGESGDPLPYASFKIDSQLLSTPQKTVPFREIYVSAPNVEGVHLRSSSVARGGLRWSDRYEDYRTEALSLMKTQSVKNSPIVPSGAQGRVRGSGHVVTDSGAGAGVVQHLHSRLAGRGGTTSSTALPGTPGRSNRVRR